MSAKKVKHIADCADRYGWLALDIGGVVCADTWETLFLTPETGLAAHYKLDPGMVLAEGAKLWELFAYSPRREDEYWQSWENVLRLKIDRALVQKLCKDLLWVDKTAAGIVEDWLAQGKRVAIVSNSTSFWFPPQMKAAGLEGAAPKLAYFLSHETGFKKTHAKGGLALLAGQAPPEKTLFVDDRIENTAAAEKLGMTVLHYRREKYGSVAAALANLAN
jgi:FMN phosphatase YigB (HAD superfamily)